MNIPKYSTPLFSSRFYEINASEQQFDQLPVGKNHDLPCFLSSRNTIPNTVWAWFTTSDDAKIETILKENKMSFISFSATDILNDQFTPEKQTDSQNEAPLNLSGMSNVSVVQQLMKKLVDARVQELVLNAIKNAFKGF